MSTFTSVDDKVLAEGISKARNRIVFIAPGVRKTVAEVLVRAMDALPAGAINIILDIDPEVCRLGYGDKDFAGLEFLQKAAQQRGLTINHHAGIRIGLLIVDDTTLIYSPTPLSIETESKQPDKPNAIVLQKIPTPLANACALGSEGHAALEVGKDPIRPKQVELAKQELQERPAKDFNVARMERVFSSMLHYVEFRIEDYKLTTRSLLLNPQLFGVRNTDVVRRLTNRYNLFSETTELTVEIPPFNEDGKPDPSRPKQQFGPLSIDRERNRIKKRFIIEAGRYGSLILRRNVDSFEREIRTLEAKIAAYREAVQKVIKDRVDQIVGDLMAALKERLKAEPPEHWESRFLGESPTDEDIRRLFQEEIEGEVNRVKTDFHPKIFTTYKDVTYQTFKSQEFLSLMKERFGETSLQRLFREYDAAPEQSKPPELAS